MKTFSKLDLNDVLFISAKSQKLESLSIPSIIRRYTVSHLRR